MTVLDLFRVLPDFEYVMFNTKSATGVWYGLVKDIPSSYFDYLVESIYSMSDDYTTSYTVINFA